MVNIRAEIVIKNISKNLRPHKGNFLKVIKMLRIKLKEHTNTTILKQTTLPWRTQYRNGKQTYHKHTFKDWSGRGRRSRGGGVGEEESRSRGGGEEGVRRRRRRSIPGWDLKRLLLNS